MKDLTDDKKYQLILGQCYKAFHGEKSKPFNNSSQNNRTSCNINKSNNALIAEMNGLFSLKDLTEDKLIKNRFNYGKDFFEWLCDMYYVPPKEIHHVGYKSTGYYNDDTLTYIVDNYDLDFLHRMYMKEIDLLQALEEKNITFCYVEAISTIVGIEGGDPVKVYCVRQNNIFWFSKGKYLKMSNNNIRILTERKNPDQNFNNKNYKKVINMLLARKRKKIVRNVIKV